MRMTMTHENESAPEGDRTSSVFLRLNLTFGCHTVCVGARAFAGWAFRTRTVQPYVRARGD
jgi:hypothetical protein